MIAYAIGYAVGYTYARTGYFPHEPHDGNILLGVFGNERGKKEIEVKFVDADQFEEGLEIELLEHFIDNPEIRPECSQNHDLFIVALQAGKEEGGLCTRTYEEDGHELDELEFEDERLGFLRNYMKDKY